MIRIEITTTDYLCAEEPAYSISEYPSSPKKLLVESLAPRIPLEIINRPKMGFTLPMNDWLKRELSEMACERLAYLSDRKEFNGETIMRQWNDFKKGDPKILWTSVWNQVVLADWLRRNNL